MNRGALQSWRWGCLADRAERRRCAVVALTLSLSLAHAPLHAHNGIPEQIAALTAQIARGPASAELLVRRAELYRYAHQWPQALADLDGAQRLDATLTSIDLARAHVLFDSGRPGAAVDAATRFLSREPRHADALIVRGRARAQLGLPREAAADFTHALAVRPTPDLYIERAHTIAVPGSSRVEVALRGLDEGIVRLGPIVTLELEAIDLELRLKRYDAALSRLDRVSAQASRKETWLARRGAILEQAGRTDDARVAYRAALTAAMTLPESTRHTRASSALIDRLTKNLDRLADHLTSSGQKR